MATSLIQAIQEAGAETRAKEQAIADAKAAEVARVQSEADALRARVLDARKPAEVAACNEALANLDNDGLAKARATFEALVADPKADIGKLFAAWVDYRKSYAVLANVRMQCQRRVDQLQPSGVTSTWNVNDPLANTTFEEAVALESKIEGRIKAAVDPAVNKMWAAVQAAGDAAASTVK